MKEEHADAVEVVHGCLLYASHKQLLVWKQKGREEEKIELKPVRSDKAEPAFILQQGAHWHLL